MSRIDIVPGLTQVHIASDHGGYLLKEAMVKVLEEWQVPLTDWGVGDETAVDYPDILINPIQALAQDPHAMGCFLCGSGIGASILANRFSHIRAALVNDSPQTAQLSRAHNNANVVCMGGRIVGLDKGITILQAFLTTPFQGERHQRRLEKIQALCGGKSS
jgi:ribose 5-phosphate isomerase B